MRGGPIIALVICIGLILAAIPLAISRNIAVVTSGTVSSGTTSFVGPVTIFLLALAGVVLIGGALWGISHR